MHNSTERSTAAAALAGLFYSSDSTAAHNRRDETKTQGPGPKKPPRAKKPNGCASRIHSSRLHPLDAPTPVHWTHPPTHGTPTHPLYTHSAHIPRTLSLTRAPFLTARRPTLLQGAAAAPAAPA